MGGQEDTTSHPSEGHVFNALDADDINSDPTEIESMCVECGENGMTRIMLSKIPHYKEIILSSFSCDHCGNSNNEIQSGGVIQEKGVRLTVTIATERDLSRQVVKSDGADLSVPEMDLEIPGRHDGKGEITTVEGVLQRVVAGLEQDQPVRRALHPEDAASIDKYVARIQDLLTVSVPFTLIVDDPSGNSFVENPWAPGLDPGRKLEQFERTREQDNMLGLYSQEQLKEEYVQEDTVITDKNLKEEILTFQTNCPECNAPADTNMKITAIPYFKEVVIMCTSCDHCGSRTNEVKSGGGMEDHGKKITLRVTDPTDMQRDVLKADTCSIEIPELEFEMGGASVGGKFTTLEGLLTDLLEQVEKNSLMGGGDAVAEDVLHRMNEFKIKFRKVIEGQGEFTVILDDPAGNSYLQNVYAPEEDPELKIEVYERSFDQNEDLGINDMKVDGYEEEGKR